MDYRKKEETKAINTQLIALVFTLVTAVISILITYNQKLELEGKKTLFSSKETLKLTLFNRKLILLISIVFLYVNYVLFKISKEEGEDLKPYKLQILASLFIIISGIIALYVVSLSNTENIADVENPII
jgi:nitric oxide reductase large subunit